MSGPSVLTGPDLARLAATIRTRHEDPADGCTCISGGSDAGRWAGSAAMPAMDVRERKWAAAKLLRPICPEDSGEEFTDKEWLMVYQQVWKMRAGSFQAGPTDVADRHRIMADQFRHTTRFARQAWGITGYRALGGPDVLEDDEPPF